MYAAAEEEWQQARLQILRHQVVALEARHSRATSELVDMLQLTRRLDHRLAAGQFIKPRMCNYWADGKTCPFGLRCYCAHGEQELRAVLASARRQRGAAPTEPEQQQDPAAAGAEGAELEHHLLDLTLECNG